MRIMRGAFIIAAMLALALAVVVVAGCSSGSAPSSGGYGTPSTGGTTGGSTGGGTSSGGGGVTINVQNFAFSPDPSNAKAGEAVTFVNQDSVQHNIKVNGQESGPLDQGKSWTVKIDKAGSYPITCLIHPSMSGTLVIK